MKLLKRIFIFVSLAAIIALVSLWAFVQYARHQSYDTAIHQDATMLIRVDKYSIYKQLLPDYIKGGSTKRTDFLNGIEVPANVFIYNVKNRSATTLITSLPIENIEDLKKSLHSSTWQPMQQTGGLTNVQSSDGKWSVLFDKERIAISFSQNKEDVSIILTDILKQKNTRTVAASGFKDIANEEGHITFMQGKNTAAANFVDGCIEIEFALHETSIKPKQNISRQKFAENNALSMWLYADVSDAIAGKIFEVDTFTISADSLLAAHPTGFELAITKPVIQRDSVVTYEYNDDFEKVATVTVKETAIPGLSATIYTNGNAAANYLQRQGIITADRASLSRQFFPLYQLYTSATENTLVLSTLKTTDSNSSMMQESSFFGLDANIAQLLDQPEFAALKPYGKLLSAIKVRANSSEENIIKGSASIHFLNKEKNALLQLY